MLKTSLAVVVAFLVGLVALPAVADVSVAADGARAANTHSQAATPADTVPHTPTAPDIEKNYSWDNTGKVQQASAWLPDEPAGPLQTMAQLAPALLMIVLAVLGLTITFTSLRSDIKRRRVQYRPRGLRSSGAAARSD